MQIAELRVRSVELEAPGDLRQDLARSCQSKIARAVGLG